MNPFNARLSALPLGTFTGTAHGRRYVVSKSAFARGKSIKLVAQELNGPDYISLNWYDLTSGARLKPCEMSLNKVHSFVDALIPDA